MLGSNKTFKHNLGFTIIEILVVLLIISITTSFAVLSFGDFGKSKKIINYANHFVNQLELIKNEAILLDITLMIQIKENGYTVLERKSSHKWQPLKNGLIKRQIFPNNMKAFFSTKTYKNYIIIGPSGEVSPFILSFGESKHERIVSIIAYSNGIINVKKYS
ncbi:MAG: type II secretion system protein GspH [Legionellales bacterium RIFCSPHIGHO2_12_FULL_35_11]|nr:MAG: type II secretion system protein GspH [Legionellales bacterium RIFCSPHIGHO2_12_FULL_35_11]